MTLSLLDVLKTINAINRLLTHFEGPEKSFSAIIDLLAKLVPARSFLIVDYISHKPGAILWTLSLRDKLLSKQAIEHMQQVITHLATDTWRDAALERLSDDVIVKKEFAIGSPASSNTSNFIALPLLARSGQVGGIMQIECLEKPIEAAVELLNAIAGQMAMALWRRHLLYQKHELALRERAAEAANSAKSEFLANMSHEIRTPLVAILGFSELLVSEKLPKKEKESYAGKIRRNGQHLTQLIDDILDLSKIEAGKLLIDNSVCNISVLLSEVVDLFAPQAYDKGINFRMICASNVAETMRLDCRRTKQVLINLVGNAIKFTSTGEVTLNVAMEPCDETNGVQVIAFTVTDTGRGISPEESKRLFQPFAQADSSTTKKFGGTGLGLALSKRLANAMGGDVILCHSERGVGSSFKVTLKGQDLTSQLNAIAPPAQDRQNASSIKKCGTALHGTHILLVDDAFDNRLLFSKILEASGARVDTADNGNDAVEQALKKVYDVVLMDLQMPVCDGFQATRNLREQGYRKPIVALSAYAMSEDRNKALDAGCNEHWPKPISPVNLVKQVAQLI